MFHNLSKLKNCKKNKAFKWRTQFNEGRSLVLGRIVCCVANKSENEGAI